MNPDEYCRIDVHGACGYLTLQRESVLNALDLDMIEALHSAMDTLESDARVRVILIRSASDRAFCAGGDMKRIRELSLAGEYAAIHRFFEREYALNARLHDCRKPNIAVVDGIAMGGGLGLSVHGDFCLVTERAKLAMPESRIGFFPDVGGSHFLPRLPFRAGYWMAFTAEAVEGQMAVDCGLASHFIPADKLELLYRRLETETESDIEAIVQDSVCDVHERMAAAESHRPLLQARARWFAGTDIGVIRERLRRVADSGDGIDGEMWRDDAAKLLAQLETASPESLRLTLSLFAQGEFASLARCLANELVATDAAVRHPDFAEGVRAVLVDKDRQPAWQSTAEWGDTVE